MKYKIIVRIGDSVIGIFHEPDWLRAMCRAAEYGSGGLSVEIRKLEVDE